MATTPEQLRTWIDAPESRRFEFKEAKQRFDFNKLRDYCVALANEGGGWMIFGVTDRRPRQVVGTEVFPEPGHTESSLYQHLGKRVTVEEVLLPEGRVVVVHVPARLPGSAWDIEGRYLKRAGDSLLPMGADELKAIFAEGSPDFSAQPCPGATWKDLDPDAIAEFRARWAKKERKDRILSWSDEETLFNAELVDDGQFTYAALILFGTRAALGKWLAQAEVVFEYRSSEASGPAADRVEYRAGFLSWTDEIWNRVNLRNDKQSYQDGLFRFDVPTFDESSVREALLNAVTHREYRLTGSVFVRQYPRRLEVVSPGGWPEGITEENVLYQQNPRNRRLAEALQRCGLIERSGQGMNLLVENALRHGKPLPSFAGTSDHEVRLTLEGTMGSGQFIRFLERLGQETLTNFSTDDFLALDAVHREQPLSDRLKARLSNLIDAGAVEAIGRGRGTRYILSRALYASIGASGVHTRKKGLDHETNKEMLVKHLRTEGASGAALSVLLQVIPAVSQRGVQQLLRELREEGRVELRGTRRWARWYLVEAKNSSGSSSGTSS